MELEEEVARGEEQLEWQEQCQEMNADTSYEALQSY